MKNMKAVGLKLQIKESMESKMDRNQKYADQRNIFIPKAEKYANDLYGASFVAAAPLPPKGIAEKKRDEWCSNWNRAFHSKMNELYEAFRKSS
jgi:hypothetical protein